MPEAGEPAAPEGTKRTAETEWSWPGNVRMFLYSSEGSQSLIVRSEEQEASRVPPRGPPKSQLRTGFVCPFKVRSSSPSSQSQILMVVSSEPEAREEKMGWNATQLTGERCDWRVCLAGDRGSQEVGSWFRREREVGVALSSSDWRLELRDSRSIIYIGWFSLTIRIFCYLDPTFFCSLTTLVHFFSRRPSYFLLVASSKESPILSSSRSAAALFESLTDDR